MDNLSKLFTSNIRISNLSPFDKDSIWPSNIEVCLTRVPIRKRDGYDENNMKNFATKLKDHIVKNGVVFLICYAPTEAKFRPFEIAKVMVDAGFTHIDNIIIHKSWYPGKRSEVNLVNSHEYVLHFCNGDIWKLDRAPIRDYLKTPENVSCPGNIWTINTGSLDESIPIDLAELLIKMSDVLPGSIIFDPFMKNKATLMSALFLGHSFFGFETDNRRMKQYEKIVEKFKNEGTF